MLTHERVLEAIADVVWVSEGKNLPDILTAQKLGSPVCINLHVHCGFCTTIRFSTESSEK